MSPIRPDAAPARVIAVASGMGCVGKSFVSTNLALALGSNNRRVCLIDTDPEAFECPDPWGQTSEFSFQHHVNAGRNLDEVLAEGPVDVGHIRAVHDIASFVHLEPGRQARVVTGMQELEARFDYLLLDIAGYIDDAQIQFLLAAPFTIITLTPEPASVSSAFSLLRLLKRYYYDHPVFVVINSSSSVRIDHEIFKEFKQSVTKYLQLNVGYLGSIPKNPGSAETKLNDMPPPLPLQRPDSPTSRCLFGIADCLQRRLDSELDSDTRFSTYFRKQMGETQPPGQPELQQAMLEPTPMQTRSKNNKKVSEATDDQLALATASRYARILSP